MNKEYITEDEKISIRQSFLHLNSVKLEGLSKDSPVRKWVSTALAHVQDLDNIINSDTPSND